MHRRALALACVLSALLVPAAFAAGSSSGATQVTGTSKLSDHSVRVFMKAPGEMSDADLEASLGGTLALVEGVRPIGTRPPMRLVLAVDTSESMAGRPLTAAIAAGQRLLDTVGPNDQAALVVFDGDARVLASMTENVTAVRTALASLSTQTGTALYDGVQTAAGVSGSTATSRRVVVVLSDGADTSSETTLRSLKTSLAGSSIELHAIGLTTSGVYRSGPLRQLTAAQGGVYQPVTDIEDLEPITVRLAQTELATDYAVDVALPASDSRELKISVGGAAPAIVELPAGVSGATESMWQKNGGPIVALLGFIAVIAAAITFLTRAQRKPQSLGTKLLPYSADLSKEAAKVENAALLDVYEMLERRMGKSSAWRWLTRLGERSGATAPTGKIVTVISAAAAIPGIAGTMAIGPILGLPLFVAGGLAPVVALRYRGGKRQRAFDAQLPELLGVWASALRAGRSFAQALDTLVEEAGDPAHSEFRRAQHQVRLGVPVEQALDDMSKRLGSESFELVVLTTDVQRRIGGNIAEIFDQVAETVRKRQQFASRVRALTAMGTLSAHVLLGMPFALAGILTLIDHNYMAPLYTTSAGHTLVVIALIMMSIGAVVLRRMVKPRATA
ncbi:MAG: tight adherence protein [Gaiellales bacterium]|jgi:tight adherence protein B|nr:tight adherence protein [Gaiellales bacterium]